MPAHSFAGCFVRRGIARPALSVLLTLLLVASFCFPVQPGLWRSWDGSAFAAEPASRQPGDDAPFFRDGLSLLDDASEEDGGSEGVGNEGAEEGPDQPGDGDEGDGDPSGPAGDGEGADPVKPLVEGIIIVNVEPGANGEVLASSYDPSGSKPTEITRKGGTLELGTRTLYADWAEEANTSNVLWDSSDTAVATVDPDGTVHAVSDGTATISAYIPGADCVGGNEVRASFLLTVTGQSDALYVADIVILDEAGQPVGPGGYSFEGDLSTAYTRFYAIVTVVDNATGAAFLYDTYIGGPLSDQCPGLPDLQWRVDDPAVAYVDPDTGQYRPIMQGRVQLICSSSAGISGSEVLTGINVDFYDPADTENPESHPASSLRVLAYWELQPPEDARNPEDPAYVVDKEFSLADIQAMGVTTATYTSFSGSRYLTTSAEGVPVASVLQAAGIDLDGIELLEFHTWDNYPISVSADYLFGMAHYYYPNVADPSAREAGAQQVFPMLAFASYQTGTQTVPEYDKMTDATRFRLVCGATGLTDHSTNYLAKWIDTVYVRLSGGPPVEVPGGSDGSDDSGDGGQGDDPGEGEKPPAGGAVEGGDDDPADGEPGAPGDEEGSGDDDGPEGAAASNPGFEDTGSGGGAVGESDDDDEAAGLKASEDSSAADDSSEEAFEAADPSGLVGEAAASAAGSGHGVASIYQVMSRNETVTDHTIVKDNPWAPVAAGASVVILGLGGVQMGLWYRRQRLLPPGA